jgi:hypothetical protein
MSGCAHLIKAENACVKTKMKHFCLGRYVKLHAAVDQAALQEYINS